MVSVFKFFLGFTSYFLITKCSDLQIKEVYKNFNYKDDKLIIDCHNLDPGLLFSQLSSIKFLNELSLQEFIFDEISVKELSKAISVLSVKKLSIIECDFNEEIATLFSIPPSVKSIHLEKLNLSSKGIEIILSKLDSSVESITISACCVNEKKKLLQSFSRFCSLKQIDIDKKSIGDSNIYHSLRSLSTASLESIKLHEFKLDASKLNSILKEWIRKYGTSFTDNLKVFELGVFDLDPVPNNELIKRLLSFKNLKILSCELYDEFLDFSINALPPKLEQLILKGAKLYIKINHKQIISQNILSASHLTHLALSNTLTEFPIYLFSMKNLEYLDLSNILCDDAPIVGSFQSPSSLKHLVIQFEHLSPFLPKFDKSFKALEKLDVQFRFIKTFHNLEKLFTNRTLKTLKLDFRLKDSSQFNFDLDSKCECSLEKLELKNISFEFFCHLFDKLTFSQLKKVSFHFKWENCELYEVLYKLQTLNQLTSLSLRGSINWKIVKKVSFMFKNLISFNWEFSDIGVIELAHLMLGMPNLKSLCLPTWKNNPLFLEQPAINIRYLYLPMGIDELDKTRWINFLKYLPNLVQLRNCSDCNSIVEDEVTAGDLAYYLKVLREYFKSELMFKIEYNCLPVLLLKKDPLLLELVRNKSKKLCTYLNEIFPMNIFEKFVKQLFIIDIVKYFTTIDISLSMKYFKLISELEIGLETEDDIMFFRSIFFRGDYHCAFTNATDFSLANFYNVLLNYLIEQTKVSLNMEHVEFLMKFFKTNKKHSFFKISKFIQKFFIFLSTVDIGNKFIDKEVFSFFSGYLLAPSFRSFFDKIRNKELSEREKKFLAIDFNSVADDLKKLEPEQYEELCIQFKDFLIKFTKESFIESFSNILKKILIPATKCAICYESLFSKECMFFKAKKVYCHLFHEVCLIKWVVEKKTCPYCCQPRS